MNLLNDLQLQEWLQKRSLTVSSRQIELPTNTREFLVIEVPDRPDSQMFLCGDLMALGGYDPEHTDMLWISDWTIWNDWNQELGQEIVCRLRASSTDSNRLSVASAHLFPFRDRTVAVAILWQVLLFRWDGWLVPTEQTVVQCSHDGLIWITCRDADVQTELLRALARWKPIVRPFA